MKTDAETAFRLLVIDDESQNLGLIELALEQQGLEILTTTDSEAGLAVFREKHPEIVLLDLVMPKISGMDLLEQMIVSDPGAEVILMTGHYSAESAVEAIRKGAADYLTKPLDVLALRDRVCALVSQHRSRRLATQLDRQMVDTFQLEGIVGRSPLMMDVFASIRRVAPHFRTALITGDTGTGKELVAHALHRLSPVSDKTFAVCNCSALVETLFESELFGHVRGAFTGATHDKVGLLEYAHQGTVFLDEIGDMPFAGQAKLLRVLQNQEVQRVGSPALRKVDLRFIAATNKDLSALIREHRFRDDLYYRLSMVEIALPGLVDRKEDFPLLQRYFIEKFATQYNKPVRGMTRRAQALLGRHTWPGNVRELENVIGKACMMVEGNVIDIKDLPPYLWKTPVLARTHNDNLLSMDEVQERHLVSVLERMGGDKSRAAEVLGISRSTLYNLLARRELARKAN
ncbi:MAG: sigma-54 dependent transcriptional regulator [Candidatus Sulfotelmatobacter sp.]|jgi:DNA-binding NtrC family response regulator